MRDLVQLVLGHGTDPRHAATPTSILAFAVRCRTTASANESNGIDYVTLQRVENGKKTLVYGGRAA